MHLQLACIHLAFFHPPRPLIKVDDKGTVSVPDDIGIQVGANFLPSFLGGLSLGRLPCVALHDPGNLTFTICHYDQQGKVICSRPLRHFLRYFLQDSLLPP